MNLQIDVKMSLFVDLNHQLLSKHYFAEEKAPQESKIFHPRPWQPLALPYFLSTFRSFLLANELWKRATITVTIIQTLIN